MPRIAAQAIRSECSPVTAALTSVALLGSACAWADSPRPTAPTLLETRQGDIDRCYPLSAQNSGREGDLVMTVAVSAEGLFLGYSLPAEALPWKHEAAQCLSRVLKFAPGRLDGAPVDSEGTLAIRFRMFTPAPEGSGTTRGDILGARMKSSEAELREAQKRCYPAGRSEEAEVTYRWVIGVDGRSRKVEVVEGSGNAALDRAGACLLRHLRFLPAIFGSQWAESTVTERIRIAPPPAS